MTSRTNILAVIFIKSLTLFSRGYVDTHQKIPRFRDFSDICELTCVYLDCSNKKSIDLQVFRDKYRLTCVYAWLYNIQVINCML